MTTEMQGGLPRRSFLAAVTAAGVLAGGGLGLVVAAASGAGAATGANVTWRITSEPADARTGYAAMLNAINQAISDHRVRPADGRPVYVTASGGATQFVTVDLHAEDRSEMIRVFLRRSDSYVMGWRQGTTNADGTATFASFFPLETASAPGGASALPGATDANTNRRFIGLANYNDLAQQGATRDGMQITPASLHNSVLNLQDSGPFISTRAAAQSILQIIVALAEAARFRTQAAQTATAFGNGQPFTVTATHIAHHNNWSVMSAVLLGAIIAAAVILEPELAIGGAVYGTPAALAAVMMLAHHSGKDTKGRGLAEESTDLVAADGTGDYWTVQSAIDNAPEGGAHTILLDKGTYHEAITVPSDKTWLTIEGVTGNRNDVLIYNTRAHGMVKPDGTKWGTQGSAVATFKPANLTVAHLRIFNTFDPAAHPEISPYETQAVAVAAMGDRQVFNDVEISSTQDTLLVKGVQPTDQARQYFVNCLIRGTVDFIFGNATAVIDRSIVHMVAWPGGTVMAPNTDYRKKYGILITDSSINSSAPTRSMYLGRPWHNSADAWPQAVVRNTVVASAVLETHPWTDMTTDYSWSWARFKEYRNSGLGAGVGANAPKLTDAEAADYTARKYLAGTDGWDPVL